MSTALYDLGRWCFRHRGRVGLAWLALLVILGGITLMVFKPLSDSFSIPGTPSQSAYNQLRMTFPEASDAGATLILTLPEGHQATDPDVRRAVEGGIASYEAVPFIAGSVSPYNEYITGRITPDGRSALVGLRLNIAGTEVTEAQRELLQQHAHDLQNRLPPGSTVLLGGDIYAMTVPHLSAIEAIGVIVALVVLVMTLGSLLAGIIPLVNALVGVGLAMAITYASTAFGEISSTTPMLALMLGLAVGIDYALFILSRHRDQLAQGMDPEESTARSVATAGSAVVFAGLTVIIALIGLSVARIPFLTVMGAFAAVAVAIGVLVALTLLPALMGFLGERGRPKVSKRAAARAAENPQPTRRDGIFGWWVRVVTKVPVLTIVIVVAALGALSLPAKDLWLSLPNAGQLPQASSARQTYDAIAKEFGPGYNGPLVVTMQLVETTDPMGILGGIKADIEKMPGVQLVPTAVPNQNADTGMIQVIPTTGPDDPETEKLVEALIAKAPEWQQQYGVTTYVTGMTAVALDITAQLSNALLPFGIFVVGLSLVLLTMVFRSIAVPIKAAVGYLLSIGSAFGLTTLVFNKGFAAQAVNLHETTAVISFYPIITMGILFGLAMDYEVFLVSRMREEHVHTGDARTAVYDGFVHSAKVVVAAALIMFAVFAFFVPNGEGPIKPIAFGLAVGVAIDAFVVRMTLVPAVMHLLGERAWWLPKWLDKLLPSFDVEGESLTRQLQLSTWPSPGDPHTIYGEEIGIGDDRTQLLHGLSLAVEPGQILVVAGDPLIRSALLLTLGARLAPNRGRLKVLGLVLPDQAGKVRTKALCLDGHSHDIAKHLRTTKAQVILLDDVPQLTGADREALEKLIAGLGTRTLVLGAARADSVRDLIRPGDLALELDAQPVA